MTTASRIQLHFCSHSNGSASPRRAVFVSDRHDIAGAHAAGIPAVRVRTGEYASIASDPEPWIEAPSLTDAVDVIVGVTDLGQERDRSHRSTAVG
ncbi:MAG: HAD hydrolase-like protein [Actinomycetota bacterium]|nr:HAD hydrolase-like protein [Actinomycetota bacterium]